jgi:hypothetical protein
MHASCGGARASPPRHHAPSWPDTFLPCACPPLRSSSGNHMELRSNPPIFVYSDAPLTTSDGMAVAQPTPGAAGYSLMISDQQVRPRCSSAGSLVLLPSCHHTHQTRQTFIKASAPHDVASWCSWLLPSSPAACTELWCITNLCGCSLAHLARHALSSGV